jgi:ABC-type transport system involved in cytochrome c biogenesis ATPase subunit
MDNLKIVIYNALVEAVEDKDFAEAQSSLDIHRIRDALNPIEVIDEIVGLVDDEDKQEFRRSLIEAAQEDGIFLARKPDPRQVVLEF